MGLSRALWTHLHGCAAADDHPECVLVQEVPPSDPFNIKKGKNYVLGGSGWLAAVVGYAYTFGLNLLEFYRDPLSLS